MRNAVISLGRCGVNRRFARAAPPPTRIPTKGKYFTDRGRELASNDCAGTGMRVRNWMAERNSYHDLRMPAEKFIARLHSLRLMQKLPSVCRERRPTRQSASPLLRLSLHLDAYRA